MSSLQEIAAGLKVPPPLSDTPIDDDGDYKPIVVNGVTVAETKHVESTKPKIVTETIHDSKHLNVTHVKVKEPESKLPKPKAHAAYAITKPANDRILIKNGLHCPDWEAPVPKLGNTCMKVNALRLLAALEASSGEDTRYYLNGFAITLKGTDAWITSTDGHMMLVQYVPLHPLSNFTETQTAIFKKIDFKMESKPKDPAKQLANIDYMTPIRKNTIESKRWDDDATTLLSYIDHDKPLANGQTKSFILDIPMKNGQNYVLKSDNDSRWPDWTRVIPSRDAGFEAVDDPLERKKREPNCLSLHVLEPLFKAAKMLDMHAVVDCSEETKWGTPKVIRFTGSAQVSGDSMIGIVSNTDMFAVAMPMRYVNESKRLRYPIPLPTDKE